MKKIYLFLYVCALPFHFIRAAADKKQQLTYTHIKLQRHIKGGELTVKIPVTDKELLTGKTFGKLAEKSFKKGMPLLLANLMYVSDESMSTETVDVCALLRAHGSWDEKNIVDGGKVLENAIQALKMYGEKKCRALTLTLSHATAELFCIGTFYKQLPLNLIVDTNLTVGGNTMDFTKQTFASLALIYELTTDSDKRRCALRILDCLYNLILKQEQCIVEHPQLIDGREKLMAYCRKKGLTLSCNRN